MKLQHQLLVDSDYGKALYVAINSEKKVDNQTVDEIIGNDEDHHHHHSSLLTRIIKI